MAGPRGALAVDLLQHVVEQVLVGDSPDGLDLDAVRGNAAPVDGTVAVGLEEGVHVVEVTIAAVGEHAGVAVAIEHAAERKQPAVVRPAHDRLARRRRQRQGERLHSPHGAVPGGENLREPQALAREPVQIRRQAATIAVGAEEFGPEALDADENDVQAAFRPARAHLALEALAARAEQAPAVFLESRANLRHRLGERQGGVMTVVAELVAVIRGKELIDAVSGEIVRSVFRGEILQVDVEETHRRGDRARIGEEREKSRSPAERLAAPAPDAPDEQRGDRRRGQKQREQDRPDRIALPDIAQHFGGVKEVIDRDEVEAREELVPEKPLGDREHREDHRGPVQAVARDPVGREREPQHQRRNQVERGEDVEQQPETENPRPTGKPPGDRHVRPQREEHAGQARHGDDDRRCGKRRREAQDASRRDVQHVYTRMSGRDRIPLKYHFLKASPEIPMSMADRDGFIWYDGKLVPWRSATTHVLTHSLHYGLAVFEGVRAYKTVEGTAIFRLRDHTERLFNSAHIYMMKIPYVRETLIEAQKEVVRANQHESCYIRPIAFYGSEKMGVSPIGATVHVAIAAWPWGAYLGQEAIDKGIRVKTSSYARHHINVTMARAKMAGTYPNSILANLEATQHGYDEGLLLDVDGFVAEGSGENLFLVKDGKLHEPELTSALSGITRASVITLANELGYEVVSRRITRDDVYIADEAFFTGTAAEVTPIRELDARVIGAGTRGPVTTKIQKLFFDVVAGKVAKHKDWLSPVHEKKPAKVSKEKA